jgi:hypothetical protein
MFTKKKWGIFFADGIIFEKGIDTTAKKLPV